MKPKILSPAELLNADFLTVYQAYEDYMLLKNYSKHTVSTYLCNFRKYHQWCESKTISDIYNQDYVKAYLVDRVKEGARWQTMNNIYSAMRKLFREVLLIEWSFKKLPRPKKERILPELISKQEVARLIRACSMLKHPIFVITVSRLFYPKSFKNIFVSNWISMIFRFKIGKLLFKLDCTTKNWDLTLNDFPYTPVLSNWNVYREIYIPLSYVIFPR